MNKVFPRFYSQSKSSMISYSRDDFFMAKSDCAFYKMLVMFSMSKFVKS